MRYQVVTFYGDGPNDYTERTFPTKQRAETYLANTGFHYSTTYGKEDVYHDASGFIASITSEGD